MHFLLKQNLNEKQIIFLFGQIAHALYELKDERVYHRDLKPENILIKEGGIKIADFGFSKVVIEFTKNNTQVGTPLYMSPQALSSSLYDLEKNDVWSAGCLLYEMVYKKLPWKINLDESVGGLFQIITTTQIHFPKDVKISEELKELINLMIEVDEEGRLDWDDIINKDIIKKSQLDQTIKGQIQQCADDFKLKQMNEYQAKQQQQLLIQCQIETQKQIENENIKMSSYKKMSSQVEAENIGNDHNIFEQDKNYLHEGSSQKSKQIAADETPLVWRLIQMHRSVYKYIQNNLPEQQEKFYFLICLKHEEYSLCKKYILMVQKLKNKQVDSNILDQIQFFMQDIKKGNQQKELQQNLLKLIELTKQNITINKENSSSTLQNAYLRYKQKELEQIKSKSEQNQRQILLILSKLKFIAYHDYDYRGGYKVSNFEELQLNQLFSYIIS